MRDTWITLGVLSAPLVILAVAGLWVRWIQHRPGVWG